MSPSQVPQARRDTPAESPATSAPRQLLVAHRNRKRRSPAPDHRSRAGRRRRRAVPALKLAARPGDAEQAHHPRRAWPKAAPRSRNRPESRRGAREREPRNAASPSCAAARIKSSPSPPFSSSRRTRLAVSASMLREGSRWASARAMAAASSACGRSCRGSTRSAAAIMRDQRLGGRLRKVVEGDEALAEPVAPPPAGQDQRHCRSRDAAIGMTYQALEDPASRRPVRAVARGRDPFLVGAAQQHRHQARLDRAGATRSAARSVRDCPRRWPRPSRSAATPEAHRRHRRRGNGASPSSAPVPARSGAWPR